jgi:hypothetical protein
MRSQAIDENGSDPALFPILTGSTEASASRYFMGAASPRKESNRR